MVNEIKSIIKGGGVIKVDGEFLAEEVFQWDTFLMDLKGLWNLQWNHQNLPLITVKQYSVPPWQLQKKTPSKH